MKQLTTAYSQSEQSQQYMKQLTTACSQSGEQSHECMKHLATIACSQSGEQHHVCMLQLTTACSQSEQSQQCMKQLTIACLQSGEQNHICMLPILPLSSVSPPYSLEPPAQEMVLPTVKMGSFPHKLNRQSNSS